MTDQTITTIQKDQTPTFTSDVTIHILDDVELRSPIMLEGLPGVGHVGKLVAEHLIDMFDAKRIIDIYSTHFPPQVMVNDDCTVRMVRNEVYAHRAEDGGIDLLILVGDHQSTTSEGHYTLCNTFLDIAEQFNVSRIYSLGGCPTGQLEEADTVIGTVNNPDLIDELTEHGVEFEEGEPWTGIFGTSGILLPMSRARGIDAACLMGITSGYLVDPKSAQAVIEVLASLLKIDVDTQALEEHAVEMEKVVAKLQEMQQYSGMNKTEDDLRYIG